MSGLEVLARLIGGLVGTAIGTLILHYGFDWGWLASFVVSAVVVFIGVVFIDLSDIDFS